MDNNVERNLLHEYKTAKRNLDELKEVQKEAQKILDEVETKLIEYLEAKGATATGKYDGLGWVQLQKPRLYANCKQDNYDQLFPYLEECGRNDLVKTTVSPQSLSSFVKEQMENGVEVPDFITVYFKPQVRSYA